MTVASQFRSPISLYVAFAMIKPFLLSHVILSPSGIRVSAGNCRERSMLDQSPGSHASKHCEKPQLSVTARTTGTESFKEGAGTQAGKIYTVAQRAQKSPPL